LDEADRLLDNEFYEQTSELITACTHPTVQKSVFSATIPSGVEKTVMNLLNNPIRVVVGLKYGILSLSIITYYCFRDTPLPLIEQSLTYVQTDQSKLPTLVDYLSTSFDPPLLVFCSTQDRASSLTEQLLLRQITKLGSLHGGMSKAQREETVHRMLAGEIWVLVTTEIAARGLDFKGIQEVINYDFPTSVQSYVHRIGKSLLNSLQLGSLSFFPLIRPDGACRADRTRNYLFHR
jgi:ATP-dependent RNA helicase DDX52/ROK1